MPKHVTTTFCLLLACSSLQAAVAVQVPEGINITGRKAFKTLEREVRQAEDQVYGRFNELNTDDLYDVRCTWETALGTRIRSRHCRPVFFANATEEVAEMYLNLLRDTYAGGMVPDQAQVSLHSRVLELKMQEFVQQDPGFFAAVQQLNVLRTELDARKGLQPVND